MDVFTLFEIEIHSFEPTKKAYSELNKSYKDTRGIYLNNIGLSDKKENTNIYTNQEGSELSSLYKREIFDKTYQAEQIKLDTIDNYCKENGVSFIDFLKIDVEGNELKVLQGAQEMLEKGSINIIQFEFGSCNISSRVFFSDFYSLLGDRYKFYRLLEDGIQAMDEYNERYEIFSYGNFAAILKKEC